ncbi:MAG: winged helix-turn-helix transcriptional regulator [Proteobacteria bacterium]|nr:winged helix-turn-helix transcriptional regulator [Pseudomonadota bacterium]
MSSSARAKRAAAEDRLDLVFHALSDRTRRDLLARLAVGPAMVTELAAPFAMSRIAVSKHLKVLERARLVVRAIDGRVHRCSLAAAAPQDVERWLGHYRAFWHDTLGALARYVERDEKNGRE